MRLPRRSLDPDVVRSGGIASGIDVNRLLRWLTSSVTRVSIIVQPNRCEVPRRGAGFPF